MMLTKEQYMKEVENKYITRRVHPKYPNIVILNYTENATYEKHWNDITLNCRGLIINEDTGEVLARPFGKFFNLSEYPEYEKDIPFEEQPEFTVKHDGSLGISYKIDGKVYWATRGSFESEQAAIAQRIWDTKYSHVFIPDEITLLVEIIDPKTRVVVNYKGESDLIIIGAINRFTGYDYNYKELKELANQLGMKVTEQVKLTVEEALKLKHEIDHNHEGWVLRWSNGKRLKIKGDEYLAVHKLAYGLSDKMKVEYWKDGKIEELILKMPEEFRDEIEKFKLNLDFELDNLKHIIEQYKNTAINNSHDRKTFALYVKDNVEKDLQYLVFRCYDKSLDSQILREHIYKHYTQYI
jgi:RNA ligase